MRISNVYLLPKSLENVYIHAFLLFLQIIQTHSAPANRNGIEPTSNNNVECCTFDQNTAETTISTPCSPEWAARCAQRPCRSHLGSTMDVKPPESTGISIAGRNVTRSPKTTSNQKPRAADMKSPHLARTLGPTDFYATKMSIWCRPLDDFMRPEMQDPDNYRKILNGDAYVGIRGSTRLDFRDKPREWVSTRLGNLHRECKTCSCDPATGRMITNPATYCDKQSKIDKCIEWYGCSCVAVFKDFVPEGIPKTYQWLNAFKLVPEHIRLYNEMIQVEKLIDQMPPEPQSPTANETPAKEPFLLYGPNLASIGATSAVLGLKGLVPAYTNVRHSKSSRKLKALSRRSLKMKRMGRHPVRPKSVTVAVAGKKQHTKRVLQATDFYTDNEMYVVCPKTRVIYDMDTDPSLYMRFSQSRGHSGYFARPAWRTDGVPFDEDLRSKIGSITHRCRHCVCNEAGVMMKDTAGSRCPTEIAVQKCLNWWGCYCAAKLKWPDLPPGITIYSPEWQAAWVSIPFNVKAHNAIGKWEEDNTKSNKDWSSHPFLGNGNSLSKEPLSLSGPDIVSVAASSAVLGLTGLLAAYTGAKHFGNGGGKIRSRPGLSLKAKRQLEKGVIVHETDFLKAYMSVKCPTANEIFALSANSVFPAFENGQSIKVRPDFQKLGQTADTMEMIKSRTNMCAHCLCNSHGELTPDTSLSPCQTDSLVNECVNWYRCVCDKSAKDEYNAPLSVSNEKTSDRGKDIPEKH